LGAFPNGIRCKDTENSEITKEMSEKNAEISARIDELICILHTNPNKFANALGYGRAQTIYDILSGKSAPSYDFFKRFCNSGYSVFINLRWLLTGEGLPIIEETYYQSDLPIVKMEMTREQAVKKLQEVRRKKYSELANKISPTIEKSQEEDLPQPILNTFMKQIAEQAEEIGQLKEQVRQLTIEKERLASNAHSSSAANVG
jgi:hypothetical protein bfra3_16308